MSKETMAAKLSREIANVLFTAGSGKKADRLVLFGEPDRHLQYDLGGWAEKPMAEAIERILAQRLAAASETGEGQ